jgi:hypothetical protein
VRMLRIGGEKQRSKQRIEAVHLCEARS